MRYFLGIDTSNYRTSAAICDENGNALEGYDSGNLFGNSLSRPVDFEKPLEALSKGTEFSYWIGNFIVSHLRATKFAKLRDLYKSGNLNLTYNEVIEELTSIDKLIK